VFFGIGQVPVDIAKRIHDSRLAGVWIGDQKAGVAELPGGEWLDGEHAGEPGRDLPER
jgi:hypothetical protein